MTEPTIRDSTEAEAAWALWALSTNADTGGYCDCGHEGLGVDWHTRSCPGANYLLCHKVYELLALVHPSVPVSTAPDGVRAPDEGQHGPDDEQDDADGDQHR